ncbi:MAG: UV damage endonuclease UvsE [Candidatus Thorarchaeota archaeon]
MFTDNNIKRIGFACKWSEINDKDQLVSTEGLNTGGTTLTWLRNNPDKAEDKMWEVMERNLTNTYNLVSKVATLPQSLRMVRLTSDMMTGYTHPEFSYFYKRSDVINRMEQLCAPIGDVARANNVRLSFHPGQFTVLASETDSIVENSIEEFEYHVDMARHMGYGKTFQDFKINVHISGRRGPQGIIDVLPRLSPEARNTITIENDEMSWGLDASLELADHLALVLDIHHHWVKDGEYILPTDDRCLRIIDSWRGVRPVIHYSVSREDYLVGHNLDQMPDLDTLLESGHKKQKLRAHSDYYWNNAVNDWAIEHLAWADIMCESKAKNLASFQLHDKYIERT